MPTIEAFGGIIPRAAWHQLPENAATVAHDIKLRNGKLEAWREKEAITLGVSNAKTLHTKGCCNLTWDTCVSVADYPVDFNRMFITGHADIPETFILNDCDPIYFYLGCPAPKTSPTITAIETFGRDCSARSYVYTYVNIFNEESAPSPPSIEYTIKDGDSVLINNMVMPPAGYGITSIRIYRTATAFRVGDEKEQEASTDYLLVTTILLPQLEYTDTLIEKYLGTVLRTREVRLPPKDLRQIKNIEETGFLAGVTNNKIHFSEEFQPYNWPSRYDMTLAYNIVNMVSVDNYFIASTDGYPYIIKGAPYCDISECRPYSTGDIPLPDISCGYAHSAIATPFGMIYSSKDGLVLVSIDGKFQIITSTWFSTDDWIKIRPDTVRLAYWRGYLFCVTDLVTFLIEIDGSTYKDFELGSLVTLSDSPIDLYTTSSGELLLLENNIVYQWNAGKMLREYTWESRELTFGGEASPTSCKIRTNNILFKLLTKKPNLLYIRRVFNERPFRLGRLGRHLYYRVGLYGTGTVEYLDLGMMNTTVNTGK